MKEVYISAAGIFLPNNPISNSEMEDFLGKINGKPSRTKEKILKQNGIETRYYALNKSQESTHSNAQMAANAIKSALDKSGIREKDVQLICTGTTQGDLPVPGFASMVHAQLDVQECDIASFQSVCASGMMALSNAFSKIKVGDKSNAVVCGSEFSSRMFKSSKFEAQGLDSLPFDAEFLRWMLSDGAGAMVLENKKNEKGLSLKIEWIDIKSHAHKFNLCMYTGQKDNKTENQMTWLDYPSSEIAAKEGAINLKQDVRLLDQVIKTGVGHFLN